MSWLFTYQILYLTIFIIIIIIYIVIIDIIFQSILLYLVPTVGRDWHNLDIYLGPATFVRNAASRLSAHRQELGVLVL